MEDEGYRGSPIRRCAGILWEPSMNACMLGHSWFCCTRHETTDGVGLGVGTVAVELASLVTRSPGR